MEIKSRDPLKVKAGRMGALKRWSNPANRRVVRLDALTDPQRALVLALVAAVKHEKAAAVSDDASDGHAEVSHAGLDRAS